MKGIYSYFWLWNNWNIFNDLSKWNAILLSTLLCTWLEYRLEFKFTVWRNWLTVGGIRSTGATACMGIASHVLGLINKKLESKNKTTLQSNDLKEWNMHSFHWILKVLIYILNQILLHISPFKRYSTITYQQPRPVTTNPLPFYATQIITPFHTARVWANHDKGLGF